MLFRGPAAIESLVSDKHGCNNGSSVSRDLSRHESCSAHRTSEANRMVLIFGHRIDRTFSDQRTAMIEGHRRAVALEIEAIQWLAAEMVSFRGHNSMEGKFMSLYALIAKHESSAKAYLDRLQIIRSKSVEESL